MPHLIFEGRQVDQILILASALANERSTRAWGLALYRELRVDPQRVDHVPTWPPPQQLGRDYLRGGDLLRAALEVWTRSRPAQERSGRPGPIPEAHVAIGPTHQEDGFRLVTTSADGHTIIAVDWEDPDPAPNDPWAKRGDNQ